MKYRYKLEELKELGLRMDKVAELAGIDKSTITKYLNGVNLEFKQETQEKLDRAFKELSERLELIQIILKGSDK